MNLLRQHRVAAFLLVLLSIAAFATSQKDLVLLVSGGALAMLSWYVTEGPRGRSLPSLASNGLIIALLAWTLLNFLGELDLTDSTAVLGRFLLWLLVIKLFSTRTTYEDRQRVTLAVMLVVCGCLETVEFIFAALVFLFLALSIWTAMLWRLHASYEAARVSRRGDGGLLPPPLEVSVGRRLLPQFRRVAFFSIATIFVGSALGFALFPRFGESRGDRSGSESVSGFNDRIDLLANERINESRRELFSLRWIDPTGTPVKSPRPIYLRGAVLDRYDPVTHRWEVLRTSTAIRAMRTPPDAKFVALGPGVPDTTGGVWTAEITMRSLATSVLFTVYAPFAVATDESYSVAFDPQTLLLRDVGTDHVGRYWWYALRVQPQPSPQMMETLQGSVDPPRSDVSFPVAAMVPIAQQILVAASVTGLPTAQDVRDDPSLRWMRNREIARAIAGWMRSGRFQYTTDLSSFRIEGGEDPIVAFLERNRFGHCEYFASALVATLRSLGIESRLITGFVAIEYDGSTEQYIVRESNAHAWVEVRTGERQWTALDPTPEDSLQQISERNRSFADNFRWIYDRVEFLWNSRVLAYDGAAQATIADRVQSQWWKYAQQTLDALRAQMRALVERYALGRAGTIWFSAIALGVVTALAAWFVAKRRTARTHRVAGLEALPHEEARVVARDCAFFADALDMLDRAGLSKPAPMTPRQHAGLVTAFAADAGMEFARLVERFYQVRYGGLRQSISDRAETRNALLRLKSALSRGR
ncbi:MAG: DUF3488 domain-containing protein [Phycisphaerales bacterium]|nr:DUF3488 domain-containing protein [Phycisphaerales bacterium]